jgi:hypothetical protein
MMNKEEKFLTAKKTLGGGTGDEQQCHWCRWVTSRSEGARCWKRTREGGAVV